MASDWIIEYQKILQKSPLFDGTDEKSLRHILGCMEARVSSFEKGGDDLPLWRTDFLGGDRAGWKGGADHTGKRRGRILYPDRRAVGGLWMRPVLSDGETGAFDGGGEEKDGDSVCEAVQAVSAGGAAVSLCQSGYGQSLKTDGQREFCPESADPGHEPENYAGQDLGDAVPDGAGRR